MDLGALYKLDKVLDSIPPKKKVSLNSVMIYDDTNKPKRDETTNDSETNKTNSKKEEVLTIRNEPSITEDSSKSTASVAVEDELISNTKPTTVFTKYFDSTSGKFYYHNTLTNVTQWETPSDGIIDTSFIAPISSSSTTSSSSSSYSVRANFTATNGSFASVGDGSYWDKVGRPDDRAGRQMAYFFDVSELERNREEAREKKIRLMQQSSNVDWREYKESKQQEKKKRRSEWLRND
jgi:hypothetical protein